MALACRLDITGNEHGRTVTAELVAPQKADHMTPRPDHNDGWDLEQMHRDEITVAMNWVIRTCQEIIRDCSHKTFWVPTGTTTGAAPTAEQLIESARVNVLNKLQNQINGAQNIISNAEHERTKRTT